MPRDEERLRLLLGLARDACAGIAAFLAQVPDDVLVVTTPGDETTPLYDRIVQLGRSTLAHPAAESGDLVWNAELPDDAISASDSIACVAVPIIVGGRVAAVMGVVDFWLPEIEDGLGTVLRSVAEQLSHVLFTGGLSGEGSLERVSDPPKPPPPRPSPETPASLAVPSLASEGFLAEMADELPDGLIVVRSDGTIVYANRTFATLAQRVPEEVLGSDVLSIIVDGAIAGSEESRVARLLAPSVIGSRARLALPGGRELPIDIRGRRLAGGAVGEAYVALVQDARQPIADVEGSSYSAPALLEEVLETIEDGVAVCDSEGRIVLVNRVGRQLLGALPDEDVIGRSFPLDVDLRTVEGSLVRPEEHPLSYALSGTTIIGEHLVLEDDSERRHHLLVSARPMPVASSGGAVLVAREITAQLDEQARLIELALHDPLTGLANRYLLLDHLDRTFNLIRSRGGTMAVLYLDLDDFKSINDQYGHDAGDEVLMAIARRLQGAARAGDLVSRLSGDEFVIVAVATELEPDVVDLVTARLSKVLSAPFHIRGRSISVGASVGWVLADPRSDDAMSLLVRADEEMYRRKQERRARREGGA